MRVNLSVKVKIRRLAPAGGKRDFFDNRVHQINQIGAVERTRTVDVAPYRNRIFCAADKRVISCFQLARGDFVSVKTAKYYYRSRDLLYDAMSVSVHIRDFCPRICFDTIFVP